MEAAHMKQAFCENMTPFRVCAELNFINRNKIGTNFNRHRFDCTNPILHARRDNAFFACNKRDNRWSAQRHDLIVNLTCQKPERQADDARAMRKHPFYRIVGFACIGGAQNTGDPFLLHTVSPDVLNVLILHIGRKSVFQL